MKETRRGRGAAPYLCECEDTRCTEIVSLTREQYEGIRAGPRIFVVYPGHQSFGDRVLAEHEGFAVIEKTGEEGALVEQHDPRF